MTIGNQQALEAAAAVWYGSNIRDSRGQRLRAPLDAMRVAQEATVAVRAAPNARLSPDGHPMDLLAPSAGHAACALVTANMKGRLLAGAYDSFALWQASFGNRPVYRGQSRPWHIQPTAWRHTVDTDRALAALRAYIGQFVTSADAIELDLIGPPDDDFDLLAIAQHYGVPTPLVDFTFDPFVALFFASGESTGAFKDSAVPAGHAVVYVTSLLKLAAVGKPRMHFPPLPARRLYRQYGLFVDFGARPAEAEFTFESEWAWVEENCVRLFFPREYPIARELAQFATPEILTPDAFFENACAAAVEFAASDISTSHAVIYMSARVKERPPWRVEQLDHSFIYDDEEFVAIAAVLERYLAVGAVIQVEKDVHLDPFVIGNVAQNDFRVLTALQEITKLPFGKGKQFEWIVSEIRLALEAVKAVHAAKLEGHTA